ncbi:MAG: aldehyde ferredoxin oxidoreductase, partial [Deltaproteobacteria bacterium]|nr:aldehyde ferredoxin oxidoreductase [Deltaproteobacteria bacterium]
MSTNGSNGASGDRLIRVDMTRGTVAVEPFPSGWKLLGGRALSARILLEECDPTCDPLGPDNVLILAPGTLAGTAAPTSGRISIGAKSPLTNGIKEANAGGNPGQDLNKLGYRVVIVKGQPADADKRWGLEVSADEVKLVPADEHAGKWNYALCEDLTKIYSKKASFITIGPAGELRLKGASVACTDQDSRHPARHAARGGLGAVMGSKGLKYVAIDPGRSRARKPADAKGFAQLCKKYTRDYLDGPQMFKTGTSSVVPVAQMLNTFPTRNRVSGQSPHAESLDGKRIVESFETRGGGMHNCLTGCVVKCSNIVHDAQGHYKTSALEFETITMLGANCDIGEMDDVADLDRLCDEVGLDTIEMGAAIAVYMDAGKMEFGDAEGAKRLLKEIAEGTELGRMIGNGAAEVGKQTHHHRVPVVKGQAIPAWDPRPLKATGVTYATSPMGADHTAGLIVNPGMPEDQWAQASQEAQLINAVCDSSGFCQFMTPTLDDIRTFYGTFLGEQVTREQIADLGWQSLQDEWEFNRRAGYTDADDVLPDCMKEDAIGPDKLVFDVKP